MNRRAFLGAGMAIGMAGAASAAPDDPARPAPVAARRFKQGLTRMVLGADRPVEECCRIAAELGCRGLDFFSDPADWPTLKKHGLVCSMYRADYGGASSRGGRAPAGPPGWHAIGMKEAQGEYLAAIRQAIDVAGDNGLPNVILLAGTRHTVSYEEGAANALAFCNLVKGQAEARGVTLCIELINSTGFGGPPLSLFDHAQWGFELCANVASPRVKVLYDCFHAQLMDGNLTETITKNIQHIGHIHVGGVPGRHEIGDDQEINYGFLGRAIASTGFDGFVSHEWTPSPGGDEAGKIRRSVELLRAG